MLQFRIKNQLLWSFMMMSLAFLGVYLFAAEQKPGDARSLADRYQEQGNYRDAWEIYQKLATDRNSSDKNVVHDFQEGIQCLQRLNRVNEIDQFRETVL